MCFHHWNVSASFVYQRIFDQLFYRLLIIVLDQDVLLRELYIHGIGPEQN